MNEQSPTAVEPVSLTKPARQLWLLAPARPLVALFGHEFFRSVPREPGVYIMRGTAGRPRRARVLYVGKAKSLRQRLGSYRHVHPDRDSRKTLRLVQAVEEISWEICADETAALLRENQLLREHRPLFNRVNVRPEAHGCIGLRRSGTLIEFCQSPRGQTDDWRWFGAFKAGRHFALAALLRLLLQAGNSTAGGSWEQLPAVLLRERAPVQFQLKLADTELVAPLLNAYFTGASWELVDWLEQRLESAPAPEPFLASWWAADLETVRSFYLNGPRRNRRWREMLGLPGDSMLQAEELDDLPIKLRLAAEPSPWPRPGPIASQE